MVTVTVPTRRQRPFAAGMQSTSPSAVPLPVSPNHSESELEALIDLIATDEPSRLVQGGVLKKMVSQPAHDLRDEGGRLDFSKIKNLFSSNGKSPLGSAPVSSKSDKGNLSEAAELTQAVASQVLGSPVRDSGSSSLVLLQPPINIVDSPSFDSGLPPVVAESTPIGTTRLLQCDDLDLIDLSSDQPPWAPESNEAEASPSGIPVSLHGSLPLREKLPTSITASLALARQEVAILRKRVQELENLIQKSRDQFSPQLEHNHKLEGGDIFMSSETPFWSESNHQEEARMQRGADELKTHHAYMTNGVGQARDFDTLSLAETRFALKSLLDDLGLPPSSIPSLLIEGREVKAIPTSSLDEIHRAVDLVTFLDELVWRRSRMGAVYDNAYSEENVRALRDRVELWERTVRTRR